MNSKGSIRNRIVDAVVSCCADEFDGRVTVTSSDVLSKCRVENVVMTRQIVAMQLKAAGYTTTTIAQMLNCTGANARKLINDGYDNLRTSRAFHIEFAESTLLCREILK